MSDPRDSPVHSDEGSNDGDAQPTVTVNYPVGVETEVPGTQGQLHKTVLVEGSGSATPQSGAKVVVHYVGTLASDGSKFDSSRDRADPFEFTIGQGQVIKGWDVGVATMKKGEKSILRCGPTYAYGARGSPPKIPANATLNFEVELLSWDKGEDISERRDKSMIKETLVSTSNWESADYEARVVADVDVYVGQGSVDAATSDAIEAGTAPAPSGSQRDWTIVIGETPLPDHLEYIFSKLKNGERAAITLTAAAATAESFAPLNIPGGQPLRYVVTVKELHKVKPWQFQGQAKLDAGIQRKDQANAYFKAGDYSRAEKKYNRSLEFLEFFSEDEFKAQAQTVCLADRNNLAQVFLNKKEWAKAVEQCDKALEIESTNAKALFRRAKARWGQTEWDEAKADLKALLSFDPANADAQNLLAEISAAEKAHKDKMKARFSNMFERMAKME